MPKLFLMRHGATLWGRQNRFAGWSDTGLSDAGFKQAASAARILKRANQRFDLCLTSRLIRAQQSLDIIAKELNIADDKIIRDWRLNERHYGSLQGELRTKMIETHGNAQIVEWRRGFHGQPPPLEDDDPRWAEQLQRLGDLDPALQPRTESMAQAAERAKPVWDKTIAPALKAGKDVLVVAHTSPIRGIIRIIENLNDEQSAAFRIPTAIPRLYILDHNLAPIEKRDLIDGLGATLRHWVNQHKPRWLGWI